MNYIALDLEFNQPNTSKSLVTQPIVFNFEIIQIGAVKLDENYHAIDFFDVMVNPKYYKTIHRKVAKLTKITEEDLKNGLDFPTAFKSFKEWCGKDFAFITWGNDDIPVLCDNMKMFGIDTRWIPDTYNIQLIFDDQITKEMKQFSLTDAMKEVGENILDVHNALSDAKSTAKIFSHLDIDKGIENYKALERRVFCQLSPDCVDSFFSEDIYASKSEGLKDKRLVSFLCPACKSEMVARKFIRQETDKFISVCSCKNGHRYFVRFKFKKAADGEYSAYRLLYELTSEKERIYNAIKNKSKKVKRRAFSKKGSL